MTNRWMSQVAALAPTSESRRAIRRNIELECVVYCDLYSEPIELMMTDLSEDGLWLDTALPLDIGTHVTLSFQPDDWNTPLCVAGRVRRVELQRRGVDPRRAGMGIGFELLRSDERRRLSRSLRSLTPRGAKSVAKKTLLGIPVGPHPVAERRDRFARTKTGWASPPRAPQPPPSEQDQDRRRAWPRVEQKRPEQSGFRGGLRLISSVFQHDD